MADATIDLSGVYIIESDFSTGLPRHIFRGDDEDNTDGDERTILRAGEAIVVFGGGDVSNLSEANVQFVVANAEDPGLQYGLSMADAGEHIELLASDAKTVIAEMAYGDADPDGDNPSVSDASLVLEPDVWGTAYVHHEDASGSTGLFSPGTYVDGSAYPGPDGRYTP